MSRVVLLLFFLLPLYAQERIVTLSPAIAEIVSGLGEMESIVGVSEYTLYPKALTNRVKVGGYTTLSIEKVLLQKPTLVIGLSYQEAFLSQLEAFDVRTQVVRLESIDDIKESITTVSRLLLHEDEGKRLISEIEMSIENAPRLSTSPSVLIVFANASALSRGVYVAGHDLFFEEILQACGATNAYTTEYSLQPVLDIEGIIATDPDHVLLLLGAMDKDVPDELRKQWQALPIKAAKERKIDVIKNDYILIPSQRIAQTITTICEAIQ